MKPSAVSGRPIPAPRPSPEAYFSAILSSANPRLFGRDAFNDDGAIIGSFEPMFACRLVGRAVIPSSRLPKGWKFQHHHVLAIRALNDFLVSVRESERDRMTSERGGSHLPIKIELSLVVRPLFYEDHIGCHGPLLFSLTGSTSSRAFVEDISPTFQRT